MVFTAVKKSSRRKKNLRLTNSSTEQTRETNDLSVTIALDAMGGDHGVSVTVPAALSVLNHDLELKLILVGQKEILEEAVLKNGGQLGDRLSIHAATQVVEMDDPPALALRSKKDSSMRVAINLVKEGSADACVSAGNTGALMATSHFVLRPLPGIERPAICTTLPTVRGHVHMLDLGANVDCSPQQLFQFGVMGSILVRAVEGIKRPKIALLNIGEEDIKGNEAVKAAHQLLRESSLNYSGYAEGDEIYTGDADVIVCDGFVGNVALKTSEGLAQMVRYYLGREFKKNIFTRLAALFALPVLSAFRKIMDHRRYNGASLVGLNGVVIKSHGGADVFAFENAIKVAISEAKTQLPKRISDQLGLMLGKEAAV